jgi:hypothetical protein
MTMSIVVGFETIRIDHKKSDGSVFPHRTLPFSSDYFVEVPPIVNAG